MTAWAESADRKAEVLAEENAALHADKAALSVEVEAMRGQVTQLEARNKVGFDISHTSITVLFTLLEASDGEMQKKS